MATVTREQLGTLHDKITVKLAKEDFMPSYEKTLKQYAKTANIPGFRKGMVPPALLRKMAGQSIYTEEVMRTASKEMDTFMRQERIATFGQPMLLPLDDVKAKFDMHNPTDVDLAFEIGVKPEFEIPAIANRATLNAYKIPVTDAMVSEQIGLMQQRFGHADEQEEVTDKSNIIHCTLQLCDVDGNVLAEEKVEQTTALEKMPAKLQERLMNKLLGSVVVFQPSEVCSADELTAYLQNPLKAGPDAADNNYLLSITKIEHMMAIEVGQELYARVFPYETIADEAEFQEKVRAAMQVEYDQACRERFHNEIFELLVHDTPIQLPVTFLKRWLKEGGETPKTELEVEETFSSFEHQLRWQLVTDKIVGENNLAVTREELEQAIRRQVLGYYNMPADEEAPWLEPYVAKVMKDDKLQEQTYNRLMTDKLFAFLETQFTTQVVEVDEAAFVALPNPHAAHHHHHH